MILLCALFLLLLLHPVSAQQADGLSPLYASYSADRLDISYAATSTFGSHINSIGVNALFRFDYPISAGGNSIGLLEAGILLTFDHYFSYLGIPGPSDAGSAGFQLGYGFGGETRFPTNPFNAAGPAQYNIFYRYLQYLSTDGTSQNSGRFGFEFAGRRNLLRLQIENDSFPIPVRDEFRTAAGELEYQHAFSPDTILGLAAGFMLWTGTTFGLQPDAANYTYLLANQYGGHYSHGIAYVSLIWNAARLSVGWDAEWIRDALQNTLHQYLGYGTIPTNGRKDRLYFELSLFSMESLY